MGACNSTGNQAIRGRPDQAALKERLTQCAEAKAATERLNRGASKVASALRVIGIRVFAFNTRSGRSRNPARRLLRLAQVNLLADTACFHLGANGPLVPAGDGKVAILYRPWQRTFPQPRNSVSVPFEVALLQFEDPLK